MNMITNSAAMLVIDSGSRMSLKNFIGPAPSTRAASINSSGTVMKNCRNRKVAVAEAISGIERPAKLLSIPRSATTWKVGTIRTSTGSISVRKMIQKKKMRNGKRK
jgi:hypothetical protein